MASLDGLDPQFAQQIQAMVNASGGRLYIESGYRSDAQQAALYADAVRKYGEANAGQWVAPPGQSNHNRGLAVDLGGDIDLAHRLAPQFGLVFPMSWEPWHIEPVHARETSSQQAYTNGPPGTMNPTQDQSLSSSPPFLAAQLSNSLQTLGQNPVAGVASATTEGASGAQPQQQSSGGGGNDATLMSYTPGGGAFGGVDSAKWATDFLNRIGKPVTGENIRAITAWMRAESGGGGGRFNPLNTTQGGFAGESNLNSVGVKNYQSYEDGLAANAHVINNGLYGGILDALGQGNNAMAVAQAIKNSPWGTGGLVEKILGGGQSV